MKVLAQRGTTSFIVAVDEKVNGMDGGRVVDISQTPPKVYPVQAVGSIAKFGYWEPVTDTAGASLAAKAASEADDE